MVLAVVSHFAFCYFNMSGYNPCDNMLFNATSIAWPLMWGLILLKVWDMERLQIGKMGMPLAEPGGPARPDEDDPFHHVGAAAAGIQGH